MRKFLTTTAVATLMMGLGGIAAHAEEGVEVLHWWTSGGEAAALDVLKKDLESKGISWVDMPVAGGGGTEAMTVLRARVTAGNAPTAVQMLGFDILDWAKEGALGNLDDVAAAEGWDTVIPTALQQFSKYDGHWIAAPVNVHSTNWIWINKAALDKAGGNSPKPGTSWSHFSTTSRSRASRLLPMAVSPGRTRRCLMLSCYRLAMTSTSRPSSTSTRQLSVRTR
jgi:glucose/mannose transport system substrate-binding protein